MSNFTLTSTPLYLDELLDNLGFDTWKTVMNKFILPPINLIGIVLCSFSFRIFSRPLFEDPKFFYYKLLCLFNLILLIHNIPVCFLFSPRYFPMIDTYAVSIYQIYYGSVSTFLYHFLDVLQMAILLHKMRLYVPFVKQHFKAKPQLVSLALFLTCLFIDIPFAFYFKIGSLGDYFYLNEKGEKQVSTFYFNSSSDFGQTLFGQIVLGFTSFFLSFCFRFHIVHINF